MKYTGKNTTEKQNTREQKATMEQCTGRAQRPAKLKAEGQATYGILFEMSRAMRIQLVSLAKRVGFEETLENQTAQ